VKRQVPGGIGVACVFALVLGAATAASGKEVPARSGADLYTIHCARCHSERYPTERTDGQWQTIVMQMRVHASLPGQDAKKIVDYLKSSN
jgi:hypothetical protein